MERPAGTAARARLLALIAAVLLATIPLLPFYGNDQTIFSLGWPFRWTASYLIGEWASTAVIVVGVVLLTRSRRAMAAGVFLAVAIQTLISYAKDVLAEPGILRTWETGVRVAMATVAGILLLLATTSLRAASPPARPSGAPDIHVSRGSVRRPEDPGTARAWLLALVAAGLAVAIPLLPLYGNQTIFLFGWPSRWIASYLIGQWARAAAIVVGVVLLTRSRQAMAAGVFLAVAIQTLILVVNPTVVWGNLPGSWWAWLALVMRTGVGILLILAVTAAQRASTAGDEAVDGRLRDADDGST